MPQQEKRQAVERTPPAIFGIIHARGARLWPQATAARLVPFLLVLCTPATADVHLLIGTGVLSHTEGGAQQISVSPMSFPAFRLHFTNWEDNSAISAAYDLHWRSVNLSLGLAHVRETDNDIDRHTNFYTEIGWQMHRHFRCQFVHYSSTADDQGENLGLCGVSF